MKTTPRTICFFLLVFNLFIFQAYAQSSDSQSAGTDPDLLIFSTTHRTVNYTKKKTGVIKIEIVSFNPIQSVDFNGEPVSITDDRKVALEIPYDLSTFPDRKAKFTITAITDAGSASKTIAVNFGSRPKKSPLQIVGILGVTSNDNINSVPEDQDKDSDIKAVLTVVPRFTIPIRKNSDLVVKGIMLREKYSDEDNKGKEISYTQVSVGWVEKKSPVGKLSIDLGYNDIRMENANILVGEQETSTETFFKGTVEQDLTRKSKWKAAFQYKIKDSEAEPSNINYESDANEYTISGGLKEPLLLLSPGSKSFRTSLSGSIAMNDAKGKYMDSNSMSLSAKLGYPIKEWTPEIKLKSQLKNMVNEDPFKDNMAKSDLTTTLSVKLKYKLLRKTVLSLELKHKNAASNVETSAYKQNLATLSVTRIF